MRLSDVVKQVYCECAECKQLIEKNAIQVIGANKVGSPIQDFFHPECFEIQGYKIGRPME